jgi:hypothetical protein
MSYEVELTKAAAEKLNALPDDLRSLVVEHLETLGDSPSSTSRPVVSPPYPPGGMMYEFDCELDREQYHVTIFFVYSQDEIRIIVINVGYMKKI